MSSGWWRRLRRRLRRFFCRHRVLRGPKLAIEDHELTRVFRATVECQDCDVFLYCAHAISIHELRSLPGPWAAEKLAEFSTRHALHGLGVGLERERLGWWRFL